MDLVWKELQDLKNSKKHLSEVNKGKKLSKETKSKLSKLQKQMRWYTNGIENLRQNVNLEIPDGFWPGRTLVK